MNRTLTKVLIGAALSLGVSGQDFQQTLPWYDSCKLRVIGTSAAANTGNIQARNPSGQALTAKSAILDGGQVADYAVGSFPGASQITISTTGPSIAAAVCREIIGADGERTQTGEYIVLGQDRGVASTPGLQNGTLQVTADKPTVVQGLADVQSVGALQTETSRSNDTNVTFSPSAIVHQRIERGRVLTGLMPPGLDVINYHPHIFEPTSNWTSTIYIHNPHKLTTTSYTYPAGKGNANKPLVRDIQPGQTITIPGALFTNIQAAEVLADRPVQTWTTYTWRPDENHEPQEIMIPGNTRVNAGNKTLVPFADAQWSAIAIPNYDTKTQSATISLFDATGKKLSDVTKQILPKSTLATTLDDLFTNRDNAAYATITTATPTATLSFVGDYSNQHAALAGTQNPPIDDLIIAYTFFNGTDPNRPSFNPKTREFFNHFIEKRTYRFDGKSNNTISTITTEDGLMGTTPMDATIPVQGRQIAHQATAGALTTQRDGTGGPIYGLVAYPPTVTVNTANPVTFQTLATPTYTISTTEHLRMSGLNIGEILAQYKSGPKNAAQAIKENLDEFANVMAMPGFNPAITLTAPASAYKTVYGRYTDGDLANGEVANARFFQFGETASLQIFLNEPTGPRQINYVMLDTIDARRKFAKLVNIFIGDHTQFNDPKFDKELGIGTRGY